MLAVLWVLNCYWSILILRIAYNKIFRGSWANDLHGDSLEANDVNLIKKPENSGKLVVEKAKAH